MSRIHHLVPRLLPLAILFPLTLAAQVTVRGTVFGAGNAPLAGVRVVADEFGASRDTDNKGSFGITVPPEQVAKGIVRLTFTLRDHQTYSIDVKLPHTSRLQVFMSPLFARSFQPTLPPDFTSRLRDYRQEEIERVHTFLGSQEKKLLILEGLPSVDASDLLLVSLQDVPAGPRKPILWWDCEETDSLTLIAEEWARAFRDTNLRNLLQQKQQLRETQGNQEQDRRDLDREILAWLLTRLEKSPHTIVLTRFDQWLAPESRQIEDAALSDFVRRVVNHPQTGKMILVSEEKPVLPRDLNPAWVEGFLVPGISIDDAVDFLQYLGLRGAPKLVKQAAERLDGRPRALRLLAGSMVDLEPAAQDDRLRQFIQVQQNPLSGSELQPLLEDAYERLSTAEVQALGLLTIVRQPLSTEKIQKMGADRTTPFTTEEVRLTVERLAHERYWLESLRDEQTGDEALQLMEMARPFLKQKVAADRAWEIELRRKAFTWYQRQFRVDDMDPLGLPSITEVAGYNELVHQALSLAEITDAEESKPVMIIGCKALRDSQGWHLLRDLHRLRFSYLEQALRLLEGQQNREARHLYADMLMHLGNLYVRMERMAEAEKCYKTVLPLYQANGDRRGEAATLSSLGSFSFNTYRFREAEDQYRAALFLYQEIEERRGMAWTLALLGGIFEQAGHFVDAEKHYQEALYLYQEIDGGPSGADIMVRMSKAAMFMRLGFLYQRTARPVESAQHYEEALRIFQVIKFRLGEAAILVMSGTLHMQGYHFAEAERMYEAALAVFRDVEFRMGEASTLVAVGNLYVLTNRAMEAEVLYREAASLCRAIDFRMGEATALFSLGEMYLQTNRHVQAEKEYEKALSLFREIGDGPSEARALLGLGRLRTAQNRTEEAKEYSDAARSLTNIFAGEAR